MTKEQEVVQSIVGVSAIAIGLSGMIISAAGNSSSLKGMCFFFLGVLLGSGVLFKTTRRLMTAKVVVFVVAIWILVLRFAFGS